MFNFLSGRLERQLELDFSAYTLLVGLCFMFIPNFVASSVYDAWREAGVGFWGLFLILVSLMHVGALILNGRNSKLSRSLRVIACSSHLFVVVNFGIFFYQGGAAWGALTMLIFGVWLIRILGTVVDDAKLEWGR